MAYGEQLVAGSASFDSDLVQRARDKLDSLPLAEAAAAGYARDRSGYFLNIAYPSMQAMEGVSADQVFPSAEASETGKSDVALYVHVPFCSAECSYCHYYKEFRKPESKVDAFLEGIEAELEVHSGNLGLMNARSVYIGGGTPSYLTPPQMERLFAIIRSRVSIEDSAEVSFEMHPESSDDERLAVLAANGVNRISLGIESFSDQLLLSENRRHTRQEAIDALNRARALGFSNINFDLIYGLKGQTIAGWEDTLDTIGALQPSSATLYYLRIKRSTPEYNLFRLHPERFPTDEALMLMHAMTFEHLEGDLGYTQNPVDWFIKDPKYFHTYQDHNWRKSDETELLGIGPSAYSYMNGWQYYNINDTDKYLQQVSQGKLPVWRGEHLEGDERMRRTIMLGIKMGMDRRHFQDTYDADVVDTFPGEWDMLSRLGLVEVGPDSVMLTYMGKLLADEVGKTFYSDQMRQRMATVDPHMVSTTWPQINK